MHGAGRATAGGVTAASAATSRLGTGAHATVTPELAIEAAAALQMLACAHEDAAVAILRGGGVAALLSLLDPCRDRSDETQRAIRWQVTDLP